MKLSQALVDVAKGAGFKLAPLGLYETAPESETFKHPSIPGAHVLRHQKSLRRLSHKEAQALLGNAPRQA